MSTPPEGRPASKWHRVPKPPGSRRIELWLTPEEQERYNVDAVRFGFPHVGVPYLRQMLLWRYNGMLLILDPATQAFGQMIGAVLGEAAGEVLARVERAYLEGK